MRAARVVVALVLVVGLAGVALWMYRTDPSADPSTTPSALVVTSHGPVKETQVPALPAAVEAAATAVAESSAKKPAPSFFSTLRGRVIDAATRQPVREFVVEFVGTQATKAGDEAPGARTFNSDDGVFEWDFLPPGSWVATVSAAGYQRFELTPLRLRAGEATPEIVMPMRAGNVVRGRVYDESNGAGIPGATVQFRDANVGRWEGNFRLRPSQKTAEDGTFLLDGVPPGEIKLTVYAQNYAGKELDVTVSGNAPSVEIPLSAGGIIAGRLTRADGVTPVSGTVGVFSEQTQSGSATPTGAGGQFSYTHLEPGRYRVTGQAEGRSVTREVTLARGQRIENLVLTVVGGGRSIRGVVTGVRPDLFRQVSISVQRSDDPFGGQAARIDDRGTYTINGVEPGRLEVVAEIESRMQLRKPVVMTADSDATVDFAFPAGARVSGRVTRQGRGVPALYVYPRLVEVNANTDYYGTHTSAEGYYVLEQLTPGEYFFVAGPLRTKAVRVSGDMTFDIEIPDVQLSGRVLEAGKVPVVGAEVELWNSSPGGEHVHVVEHTNHFGAFELIGIEPGSYMLTAYKPGYAMYREPFTYTSPAADLVLPLRKDKGVEIRVRYADTGKVPGSVYVVEQLAKQHGSRLSLRLDEFGVAYLPAALTGRTLSFAAGDYEPVVIRDWSGQSLDLKLERAKAP